MRRIVQIYILSIFAVLSSCTQTKIIPDSELAEIFRDAYLVNAYSSVANINMDSLLIYEPIFDKYGYTVDDVKLTIGNFSKRKSARLGDIVERSIKLLEEEGRVYDREVAILDTIDAVSMRRLRRVVVEDSVKTLYSMRDTSRFIIRVKDIEPGEYTIKFDYLIDSMDRNVGSYRTMCWFERDGDYKKMLRDTTKAKAKKRELKHYKSTTVYLSRGGVKNFTRTISADTTYSRLVIDMVDLMAKKRRPHIKIRDFEVVYTPKAEDATQEMFDTLLPIKLFTDELLPPAESQNSL